MENPGENFLSRAHKFCLPKSGRKGEWKIDEEYFVHNALWNQVKKKEKEKKRESAGEWKLRMRETKQIKEGG